MEYLHLNPYGLAVLPTPDPGHFPTTAFQTQPYFANGQTFGSVLGPFGVNGSQNIIIIFLWLQSSGRWCITRLSIKLL